MKNCERCGAPTNQGQMSCEEFKTLFKVGDIITGWSTRKRIRITAIGEERILFRDIDLDSYRPSIERVAKIRQSFNWLKDGE
jgi:hypothetical protein